ncbi:MAG: hypothetical protein M3115_07205 [Thermoproteota archaeon]|nr:hypothetical protein [Thermoproteota archaeon]
MQPTPQKSPSTNKDNNNNNSTTAQSTTTACTADPWEQLIQQVPVVDDFYNTINEYVSPPLNVEEEATKPSTIICRQAIQNGTANWCNTSENYHAEKCERLTFYQESMTLFHDNAAQGNEAHSCIIILDRMYIGSLFALSCYL